jgi:uncharacterized membrane protein YhaH (DUF805 family)
MAKWFWGAGRAGRGEYWTALILFILTGWVVHPLIVTVARTFPSSMVLSVVLMLASEAVLSWMTVCVCSRRLHDIGHSGWWQVAPLALLTTGYSLAEPSWAVVVGLDERGSLATVLLGVGLYLAFLVALGLRASSGPNRFDPPATAAVF